MNPFNPYTMKKLFYLLMLILLLTGCRASKRIAEKSEMLEAKESVVDSGRIRHEERSTFDNKLTEFVQEAERLSLTLTQYSPPDSVGKQYKTTETTVQYNRATGQKKTKQANLTQEKNTTAEGTRKTAQAGKVERREREQKEKPPERCPHLLFIGILFLIVYSAYRKTK